MWGAKPSSAQPPQSVLRNTQVAAIKRLSADTCSPVKVRHAKLLRNTPTTCYSRDALAVAMRRSTTIVITSCSVTRVCLLCNQSNNVCDKLASSPIARSAVAIGADHTLCNRSPSLARRAMLHGYIDARCDGKRITSLFVVSRPRTYVYCIYTGRACVRVQEAGRTRRDQLENRCVNELAQRLRRKG